MLAKVPLAVLSFKEGWGMVGRNTREPRIMPEGRPILKRPLWLIGLNDDEKLSSP